MSCRDSAQRQQFQRLACLLTQQMNLQYGNMQKQELSHLQRQPWAKTSSPHKIRCLNSILLTYMPSMHVFKVSAALSFSITQQQLLLQQPLFRSLRLDSLVD